MDKIYDTNSSFQFDKLILNKPISQGGNFFIRYSINEFPLYVRPPKASIKQQTIKNTKKSHCDLLFSQENESFIQWMENLENYTQKIIFQNRAQWFESELELEDIENSFTSPMKTYKSGKFYIVRTHITPRLGKIILKIYDENENDIALEEISENTQVMTILEIQGVKCSARSFQIEIELKQMMTLKPIDLFETCILNPRRSESTPQKDTLSNSVTSNLSTEKIEFLNGVKFGENNSPKKEYENVTPEDLGNSAEETILEKNRINDVNAELDNNVADTDEIQESTISENEKTAFESKFSENTIIPPPIENIDSNELCEIDFNLDEMPENDIVKIKQRDDVYYEMYREARRKAKLAKDLALSAYLEAKQIKNKYMLDTISDSDDSSIDSDVSEDE